MIETWEPHPLKDKLILIPGVNHQAGLHSVSRFDFDLGNGLWFARRVDPRTGEILAISHVIALAEVARDRQTEIFDDWAAYMKSEHSPDESDDDQVVRLVLPPRMTPVTDGSDGAA